MTNSDRERFSKAMSALGLTFNREIEAPLMRIYWQALSGFAIDDVEAAILAHISNGKFFPPPVEIKERMPGLRLVAHLSADEAWALALKMQDEAETVVYTQEIMDSWVAAKPVLDLGDEVGARMAFKGAYDRLPRQSAPKWMISLGTDPQLRHARVAAAVELGRLPGDAVKRFPVETSVGMAALENAVTERMALSEPDDPVAVDMAKIKTGIAGLRAALGRDSSSSSDARVAANRAIKAAQLERAGVFDVG